MFFKSASKQPKHAADADGQYDDDSELSSAFSSDQEPSFAIGSKYNSSAFDDHTSDGPWAIQSMAFVVPDSSVFGSTGLWHLGSSATGAARFAPAWELGIAIGTTINIVDEGVNYLHANLIGTY